MDYEVVVIGGGAAGLSAALVLGRARRRVAVVDAGEPRNAPAAHMHGFLSRDGMPPAELLATARSELAVYGVELVADRVEGLSPGFTLRLGSGGTLTARAIVLATGAADVLPDVEGVRERWGTDFLHCPYCHGWEVRDRPLGVFASVEHAHLLRQWSDDVTLFPHTTEPTDEERAALEARGVRVVDGAVARFVDGVELEDGRTFPVAALFMRPTLRPNGAELIRSLGCDVDEQGFVRVDGSGRTSVAGVWAAGNVANPRAQVITAAGEGSAVAIALNNELVERDAHA
jgi:thioredoxin reductase